MKFTHLHVHSHYSLLDGLSQIPQLVARTKELGMDAIALTDHGALYGVVEFIKECKKQNIQPIVGVETYVASRTRFDKDPKLDTTRYHLTLLAENIEGYRNLVKLVTRSHLEGFYYKPRVDKELLKKHAEGLIALSGCISGEIPRAILSGNAERIDKLVSEYRDIFGSDNFFFELGAHPNLDEQRIVNETLTDLSKKHGVSLVATQDSHYLNAEDADAHEVLLSVQTGSRVDDEGRLTLKEDNFSLRSPEKIAELFPDIPEAIENTQAIAERCALTLPFGEIQLPVFPLPEGVTPEKELARLCTEGMRERLADNADNPEYKERLEYELSIIEKTGFASYFLIVSDFVRWAKEQGIVVGPGRGSAAGSLVSYVLNITNIDPLRYDLLFERFLNPERIEPPDIDLDFADYRRDEVIRYVAEKYGHDRVAQIGTFGTMAARAAVRDAGRAMNLPYAFCDRVAKMVPFGMTLGKALKASNELKDAYENEAEVTKLIDMAQKLEGVARHVSTHAAGVVISRDPLDTLVPLQHTGNGDDAQTITQYDMHAVMDLGLLKMDFLGLRNLSIIEDTVNRISRAYGKEVNIDTLPLDDNKTYRLLADGDTTGVFQLESGGMKRYLKQLKPTEFEDIIAMVALYRPGPMEYIPTYVDRKHGREQPTYLHPKLKPILENTYGIGVYQEQMMQIARNLAGYSLPEADTLRKAIGKKIKSLLDKQREKLIQGMIANGIDKETARKIWELFPPFARYGFPKAHATSYAMIAYQTAYLKAHYPFEFLAAMFTHEGTNVERTAVLIAEARAHDIAVLPPDVQTSRDTFTVVYDAGNKPEGIRFGLGAIKNVGAPVVEKIVAERAAGGAFHSLEDFLSRIAGSELNRKSLESLIMAGALDNLGERRQLLSNVDLMLSFAKDETRKASSGQETLFGEAEAPGLRLKETPPATRNEKLRWEKELLGLWVSEHPLEAHKDTLKKYAEPVAGLRDKTAGKRIRIGGVITSIKKILTKRGEAMLFVHMEDLSDRIEMVVFPRVLSETPRVFRENAVVLVDGKLDERDGEQKIICNRIKELTAT